MRTSSIGGHIETLRELSDRIKETRSELERCGEHKIAALSSSTQSADSYGRMWARDTAERLRRDLGGTEQRAVVAGSVDVPILLDFRW